MRAAESEKLERDKVQTGSKSPKTGMQRKVSHQSYHLLLKSLPPPSQAPLWYCLSVFWVPNAILTWQLDSVLLVVTRASIQMQKVILPLAGFGGISFYTVFCFISNLSVYMHNVCVQRSKDSLTWCLLTFNSLTWCFLTFNLTTAYTRLVGLPAFGKASLLSQTPTSRLECWDYRCTGLCSGLSEFGESEFRSLCGKRFPHLPASQPVFQGNDTPKKAHAVITETVAVYQVKYHFFQYEMRCHSLLKPLL